MNTQIALKCIAALMLLTLALTTPRAHAEPCEPQWVEGVFCLQGLNSDLGLIGEVNAAISWDDGSGEALFVGGDYAIAGCNSGMGNIAKWDGTAWSPLTGPSGQGLNGKVYALSVFDDGTGPALYVGGSFTTAGGVPANSIAKWDGVAWSPLSGPSGQGMGDETIPTAVRALSVFDDGSGPALYAGGKFTTAGGVQAARIAKWDGTAWSSLTGTSGEGMNDSVSALSVFDDGTGPALYAGGWFTTAGGTPANAIAKWDGSDWSPLTGASGQGVNYTVLALSVFNDGTGPALYAGGAFTTAGGMQANRIAKWDGAAWAPLTGPSGQGVSSTVYALSVFDDGSGPALYAGGRFSRAGGMPANAIAKWNGIAWSPLSGPSGQGVSSTVPCEIRTLSVFDDGTGPALYAGGNFTTAGGLPARHIAKWDGTAWSPPTGPGVQGVSGSVRALSVFDDGTGPALYAGGAFTIAGVPANRIAEWDGAVWSPLTGPSAQGMNSDVFAMTVFDDGTGPALYAGGQFTAVGGVPADRIAEWDGAVWSPLAGPSGQGMNARVEALSVFDDGTGPALYAGGSFSTAGGVAANHIAKWDGTAWSSLTGPSEQGMNGDIFAMTVFDDGTGPALYAGGDFTTAGGVAANHIAKWDGTAWSSLTGPSGQGMNGRVYALSVFDDGSGPALYAGGDFTTAASVPADRIAKWDGTVWSPLIGPNAQGVSSRVEALEVFDDGTGPALYAGGWFNAAGGVPANFIAKWDGTAWSALTGPRGKGMNNPVFALSVFDDGTGPALYAGGNFITAGGVPSERIAKWTACPPDPSCNPADLAEPFALLDLADIVAFITAFSAQDPAADLAEPFGVFDLDDIVAFITAFEAGCP